MEYSLLSQVTEPASHVREMLQGQLHNDNEDDLDEDDDEDEDHAMDLDSDMVNQILFASR